MVSHERSDRTRPVPRMVPAALMAVLIVLGCSAAWAGADAPKQKTFKSPEAAARALIDAVRADNVRELVALFGPGSEDLVSSGDDVDDAGDRALFVKAWDEAHRLVRPVYGRRILHIGRDNWPMPVPIVKTGKVWRFQTEEGRQEILNRRVGENELGAIQTCLAIVDAQREYVVQDRDTDQLLEYAQSFESGKGKKDGLYWEAAPGEPLSPLGPLVARATAEGYKNPEQMSPYHGYYFRILTAQGEHAKGGAYSYIVRGDMIGGFAVVAWPALYRSSGVKTFIVNHEGVVYEKDLGPETAKLATAMTVFDPDESWKKTESK